MKGDSSMRIRFSMLIALALLLVAVAGCANALGGGRRGSTVTPGPIKTLRPTFTATPAKLKPTVTPGGAAQAPAGQAQAATVAPLPASPTPAPSPTPVPPSPTPEKATMKISSPGVTNVRSGPGTAFAKVGEVQQGQSFEIMGKNQAGTWWQFSFNGQPAWISAEMVSANAAAQNVEVAANIPAAPVQPTAAPRPVQPAPAPVQPTAAPPPAPVAIFTQGGPEFRNAENTNFNVVTFWGRLGPTGSSPISGGYRMKVTAPSGGGEVAFVNEWQDAYPGLSASQFRYNAKFEAPRTAGGFRAVVVDGGGKEVSEPITGALFDQTHDVILSWWPR
jgi:hypothetical protein